MRHTRGGQLFEAVGLSDEVVAKCFTGVPSRIKGATFADLENDLKKLADLAWKSRKPIDQGGMLKFVFGKEYHAFNPDVINALHKSVRSGNYADFKENMQSLSIIVQSQRFVTYLSLKLTIQLR